MKITLPSHSTQSHVSVERNYFEALKQVKDFAKINGLFSFIDSASIDQIVVFDQHDDFTQTLSDLLRVPGDHIRKTECAKIIDATLYLMTSDYYAYVYPQGIEPFPYQKLISHELAHLLHLRYLNNDFTKTGPLWFYEGFASFVANQFENAIKDLSYKHKHQIIHSKTRTYYMYFPKIVKELLSKESLINILKKSSEKHFIDWVESLLDKEETTTEENMIEENENIIELDYLDKTQRDLVLILPGGGYQYTSLREGAPVASVFKKQGYHTAIYHYRNQLLRHPFLIEEGMKKVLELKKDPYVKAIIIIGFSAGGHFALHLLEKLPHEFKAGILSYPVVTTNSKYIHTSSFTSLFGRRLTKEELKEVSLEHFVPKDMPPIFLWHTMEDQVVKVENSILLMEELKKQGIPTEIHLFPHGPHGLSLADETTPFDGVKPLEYKKQYKHVAHWVNLALDFIESL